MQRIFAVLGIVLIAAPTFWAVDGVCAVFTQHQRLSTYEPVVARIDSSEVVEGTLPDPIRGERPGLRPAIRYTFDFQGRTFTAEGVHPLAETAAHRERTVAGLVNRFPPGLHCEARVNPNRPTEAFLVPVVDAMPHARAIFAGPLAGLLLILLLGVVLGGRLPYGIFGAMNVRPWSWLGATTLWFGWGLLVAAQYILEAHHVLVETSVVTDLGAEVVKLWQSTGVIPLAVTGSYVLLGFIPLVLFRRSLRHRDPLASPAIRVRGGRPRVGRTLTLTIEQEVRRGLFLDGWQIGLVGYEIGGHHGSRVRAHYEDWKLPATDFRAHEGETLRFEVEFEIPRGLPATSPPEAMEDGHYRFWRVEIDAVSKEQLVHRTSERLIIYPERQETPGERLESSSGESLAY